MNFTHTATPFHPRIILRTAGQHPALQDICGGPTAAAQGGAVWPDAFPRSPAVRRPLPSDSAPVADANGATSAEETTDDRGPRRCVRPPGYGQEPDAPQPLLTPCAMVHMPLHESRAAGANDVSQPVPTAGTWMQDAYEADPVATMGEQVVSTDLFSVAAVLLGFVGLLPAWDGKDAFLPGFAP